MSQNIYKKIPEKIKNNFIIIKDPLLKYSSQVDIHDCLKKIIESWLEIKINKKYYEINDLFLFLKETNFFVKLKKDFLSQNIEYDINLFLSNLEKNNKSRFKKRYHWNKKKRNIKKHIKK